MRKPEEFSIGQVTNAEWRTLWLKLRVYTWRKYRRLYELTGIDLDDLAQQAIVDTSIGKRRWPPIDRKTGLERSDVSLFCFLCQTVRSLASHEAKRHRRIDFGAIGAADDGPQFESAYAGAGSPFLVRPADIEQAAEYNDLTSKMLQLVSTDIDLSRIIRLWRACPDLKPREIADELHFTMPEMRAAQKRLRRVLDEVRRIRK